MTAAAGESTDATAEQGATTQSESARTESNFSPITSQDDLNKVIGQRLARKEEAVRSEYAGFDELKAKADELDKLQAANQTESERLQAERDAALQTAKQYEDRAAAAELAALRQRVAISEGLPPKFAAKLSGTTEEELIADAKDTFGEFINTTQSFDHGTRTTSAQPSMNDLIFGAAKRR